ncbi:MAG: LicD family protein [Bacteroidales bacterium]|nr:LicD family protein [Bacteroidales bacterium]
MKLLSLRELQLFSLDILKDVHQFCVDNGIRYSLAYGTLLGAVRHQGFIPWDDDIDIVMPRPDYELFCLKYQSSKYRVSSPQYDNNCCIPFARVFDDKVTTVFTQVPWHRNTFGVWIDVFPLDGVELNQSFEEKFVTISSLLIQLKSLRYAIRKLSFKEPFLLNCKTILRKILTINGRRSNQIVRAIDNTIKSESFDNYVYFTQLVCPDDGLNDVHLTDLFSSIIDLPFEDSLFHAFSRYDEYLTKLFGNYMELPPENERVPKQTYVRFYWK